MKLNKIINHSINLENNEIIFSLNTKIYPQEIIYKTCYTFIDRMYVYLDSLKKNEIIVSLKSKEKLTKKQPESLKDEFLNELLNILIREAVSKKNQKFLEYIIGGAITASLEKLEMKKENKKEGMDKVEKEIESLKKELGKIERSEDYKKDPLNIKKIFRNHERKR